MKSIGLRIENLDWTIGSANLDSKGYSLFESVLTDQECEILIENYESQDQYRKTIVMERYRFGQGEYKYLQYPLPDLIDTIRNVTYSKICPVANRWMHVLKIDQRFPEKHSDFRNLCLEHGQTKPTVLILKYGNGGYNTLHQDLYGEIFFPIQLVIFLNEPGKDYVGGEFVLTEQVPRAQSRAIVLQPKKGDMLLFTTNFRPVKGIKGHYRANMKHGVSTIHSGVRHTLGIIFHDAIS